MGHSAHVLVAHLSWRFVVINPHFPKHQYTQVPDAVLSAENPRHPSSSKAPKPSSTKLKERSEGARYPVLYAAYRAFQHRGERGSKAPKERPVFSSTRCRGCASGRAGHWARRGRRLGDRDREGSWWEVREMGDGDGDGADRRAAIARGRWAERVRD